MIQSVKSKNPERLDHVWFKKDGGPFKCCLCGALTYHPPDYPTPENWEPDSYEKLSDLERSLCPPRR